MSLYYLLLFFARFHDDPRVGSTFLNAGFLMISPVKVVGAGAMIAALISKRPAAAPPRQASALTGLFLFLPVLPLVESIASGNPIPNEWLSHVVSFILMLMTTRLLVCTEQRMRTTIRVFVFVYLFSTLWIFKQHFIQHQDRVFGLELDPNYEALGLVMVIPLAVWLGRHEPLVWPRRLALFSVPVLVYATLLTESRGGALALALLGFAGFVRLKRKGVILIACAAALPTAAMVMPEGFISRIQSTQISGIPGNGDEESSRIHFELARSGLLMMAASPAMGVGLGRFPKEVEKYNPRLVNLTGRPFIAHNTYLQIGAECGMPVLAIWLALMAGGIANLWRVERLVRGERMGDLAVAMRFALLAYSVTALFLTAEWVVPYWLMIFLSQNLREIAAAERPNATVIREAQAIGRHYPALGAQFADA